jgi:hypothetical protein
MSKQLEWKEYQPTIIGNKNDICNDTLFYYAIDGKTVHLTSNPSNYNTLLEDETMGFKTPLEQANEYIERLNRRVAELYAEVERVNKINVDLTKELNVEKNDYDITYYLTAEDERYPTFVLEGEFGIVGYSLNRDTGELRRVCLCHAHDVNECLCGAWEVNE